LDIVIGEGSTILELFTGKDKTLLVWWDSFFVLDFGLDIFDGVGSFHLKSDCLTRQGFDENLHFRSRFTVLNRVKMRKLVTFREKVILEKRR